MANKPHCYSYVGASSVVDSRLSRTTTGYYFPTHPCCLIPIDRPVFRFPAAFCNLQFTSEGSSRALALVRRSEAPVSRESGLESRPTRELHFPASSAEASVTNEDHFMKPKASFLSPFASIASASFIFFCLPRRSLPRSRSEETDLRHAVAVARARRPRCVAVAQDIESTLGGRKDMSTVAALRQRRRPEAYMIRIRPRKSPQWASFSGEVLPHDNDVLKNPGASQPGSNVRVENENEVDIFLLLVSPLCEETSRRMKAAGSDYTLLTSVPRPSVPAMPTWISFPARPRTPRSL